LGAHNSRRKFFKKKILKKIKKGGKEHKGVKLCKKKILKVKGRNRRWGGNFNLSAVNKIKIRRFFSKSIGEYKVRRKKRKKRWKK